MSDRSVIRLRRNVVRSLLPCTLLLIGGVVVAPAGLAAAQAAAVIAGSPSPSPSASDGGNSGGKNGSQDDGISDDGSGDSRGRPRQPGVVTFGLKPASAKEPDLRPSWTYRGMAPGQLVLDHAAVINVSAQPMTVSIYAADGQNTTAGGYSVVPGAKTSTDVGSWVTFGQRTVVVPAKSSLVLPFTLKVPKSAEPGDHAGGIVASLRSYAKDSKGNTVTVEERVGSRLYVRVTGVLQPRLTVERLEPRFDGGGLGSSDATVDFTVRNDGNVRLLGKQSLRITDPLGGNVVVRDVPELPELLPHNSFTFSVKAHGLKPVGFFTALVTVDPESVTGNVDPALAQATARQSFSGASAGALAGAGLIAFGVGGWGVRRLLVRRRARRATAPALVARPAPASNAFALGAVLLMLAVPAAASAGLPAATSTDARSAGQGAVAAGSATAATGSVTFVPGKGLDITPMYAVASGGCPADAPNTLAVLTGAGFPAEGINVVPNSGASTRHDGAFGVPLQNTLHNFAAMNGVKLRGAYTFELRCIDHLAQHVYASFKGIITFTDATHYTAPVPAEPPANGVPVPVLAQVFPQLSASPAPETAAAQPSSSTAGTDTATPAAADPSQSPAAASVATDPAAGAGQVTRGGGSLVTMWLSLVALAVALALYLRSRMRGPGRAPKSQPAPVTWPED